MRLRVQLGDVPKHDPACYTLGHQRREGGVGQPQSYSYLRGAIRGVLQQITQLDVSSLVLAGELVCGVLRRDVLRREGDEVGRLARHGGASQDAAMEIRDTQQIQDRGRWASKKSVARYKKSGTYTRQKTGLTPAQREKAQHVLPELETLLLTAA